MQSGSVQHYHGYKATSFSSPDLDRAIAHSLRGEHAQAARIYEDLSMSPNAAKEYQKAAESESNIEAKGQLHKKAYILNSNQQLPLRKLVHNQKQISNTLMPEPVYILQVNLLLQRTCL